MRKRNLYTIGCTLLKSLFLISSVPATAQVSNPSTWNAFINSQDNPIVSDTFRLQTFDTASTNNWTYSTSGKASIFDARKEGFTTQGGETSLKLLAGSGAYFARYSLEKYSNVAIIVRFGDKALVRGENIMANTYRTEGDAEVALRSINNDYEPSPLRPTRIGKNPPQLDLTISIGTESSKNGYYCIDSIYALGSIPQYSLFTGKGSWNDTISWSHLPALRHRHALINGEITVNDEIWCNDLSLNNGNIELTEDAHLHVNNFILYDNSTSLNSSGAITINGSVTVSKTFPKKGTWYFISFPFDVFVSDIDSRFRLKDETFQGSGNYLYVQTYNGEKRALNNVSTGNWEVVSSDLSFEDRPLFKKNKGYLIAIDANATDQTLTFSSKPRATPMDFGQNGNIPVSATFSASNMGDSHQGWYLCGNPLPGPLALSQIEQNPDTDGHIYFYDGSGYTAYAIGSDYVLPPYSAFFVKASTDTELKVVNTAPLKKGPLLNNFAFSEYNKREPAIDATPTASIVEAGQPGSYIIGKELHLINIPQQGHVQVMDITGRILFQKSIPAGTSPLNLPCKPGLYMLRIQAANYQAQHKCVITK